MSCQSSRILLHKKHDWTTSCGIQARLWYRARHYRKESHQADRKVRWTDSFWDNSHKTSGRQRAREKLADKEFFLSLLSSAATKRDAKAYLSRFPSVKKAKAHNSRRKESFGEEEKGLKDFEKPGVNLGSFYGATRSVQDTPVFRQAGTPEKETLQGLNLDEAIHVALVKLTSPQSLDKDTVHGVALTLSQLTRLGMASCVVVDPGPLENERAWRKVAAEQADRLATAIDACDGGKARRLDSVFVKANEGELPKVISRQVLLRPLRQNNTVIVTPVAYSESTCKASLVPANKAVLALTRELAGLEMKHDPDEDPQFTAQKFAALQKEVAVDRLIVLDPVGGIPAFEGPQPSHVFINMEQEYEDIENELLGAMEAIDVAPRVEPISTAAAVDNSNPISSFVSSEVTPLSAQQPQRPTQPQNRLSTNPLKGHLDNLRLLQQALTMLPPFSSGIITTPRDVSNSARPQQQDVLSVSQVGTRRQRNPLIHNLLTDKPVYSSSLPSARLGFSKTYNDQSIPPVVQSTFVKRGMPLTILPDPRVAPWSPDNHGGQRLTLDDPRIDLPRLVHLIEDSFNRKLDVHDYLKRVNGRIAGLIIAGEYEGGAILTWETPPDIPDNERYRPENIHRLVPYLDKFAVLKRSQGAGGVADIVFNAMVRSCLPRGVCWRSRVDNPVNKWYFERSRGTWKLNESNWAMFWTTLGVPEEDQQKFKDYEAVCRSIQPSWADNKSVVD